MRWFPAMGGRNAPGLGPGAFGNRCCIIHPRSLRPFLPPPFPFSLSRSLDLSLHPSISHVNLSFLTNDTSQNQETPLHLASLTGHEGIVKLLLDAGADVQAGTTDVRVWDRLIRQVGMRGLWRQPGLEGWGWWEPELGPVSHGKL